MFSIVPAAKCKTGVANLGRNLRIARIDFRRVLEFGKAALPFAAAAVDRSAVLTTVGAIRLEFDNVVELFQPRLVVAITPVIKQRQRLMCFGRFRSDL